MDVPIYVNRFLTQVPRRAIFWFDSRVSTGLKIGGTFHTTSTTTPGAVGITVPALIEEGCQVSNEPPRRVFLTRRGGSPARF